MNFVRANPEFRKNKEYVDQEDIEKKRSYYTLNNNPYNRKKI